VAARLDTPYFAETGDPQAQLVALLEEALRLAAHAHARRRAGGDDVTRFERHEARHVAHELRDAEDHAGRVPGLHALAVQFQVQVEVLHVEDLVACDEERADRAEGIAALALVPLRAHLELEGALGHVVDDAIAGHELERVFFAHVLRARADDHPEFDFPVGFLRALRQLDRIVGAVQGADRLGEEDRFGRHLGARFAHVVQVVHADADELADALDRHAQARITAHEGQRFLVEFGQFAQRLVGQLRRIDVVDDAGQVAQAPLFIEQARLFLARAAVANQSHDVIPVEKRE
jgi:hypothetical protein